MSYYVIHEDKVYIAENQEALSRYYLEPIQVLPDDYNSDKYIVVEGELILNPDYEEEMRRRERERLDALTLTPADVERALYKAKGMDFEDLKALIAQQIPQIDTKALSIEFRAKDFFRGAMYNGMRLLDVVGALLGYSPSDMDYLFEHKELPNENPTD